MFCVKCVGSEIKVMIDPYIVKKIPYFQAIIETGEIEISIDIPNVVITMIVEGLVKYNLSESISYLLKKKIPEYKLIEWVSYLGLDYDYMQGWVNKINNKIIIYDIKSIDKIPFYYIKISNVKGISRYLTNKTLEKYGLSNILISTGKNSNYQSSVFDVDGKKKLKIWHIQDDKDVKYELINENVFEYENVYYMTGEIFIKTGLFGSSFSDMFL